LVVVTTADAVLVYLQRQPPALLHHDALDLIALALIERLIGAPWPVHFQMVQVSVGATFLSLPTTRRNPSLASRRKDDYHRSWGLSARQRRFGPCIITAPSTGWSCAAPRG
jgi:hypothetical protein